MSEKEILLPKIQYLDFVLFIAHMDTELSYNEFNLVNNHPKKDLNPLFIQPNLKFTERCLNYIRNNKTGIISNAKLIHNKKSINENHISSYLYSPASFVSFGFTDNVSFVACSDFDPVIDITTNIDIPIKQATVAFCPSLKSLNLYKSEYSNLFEISEIFNKTRKVDNFGLISHDFFNSRPLFTITYFRLSGLAALGPGLLFQEAIFKEIGKRVEKALSELRADDRLQIEEEDIENFACILIDPQGWADIGTLMFANNYSLIAYVLMELRNITFNDIYKTSKEIYGSDVLEVAVKEFGIFEKISKIDLEYKNKKKRKDFNNEHSCCEHYLRNNHVFSATHTTAGMTHDAFFSNSNKDKKGLYKGYINANPTFNFSPGHVQDFLKDAQKEKKSSLFDKLSDKKLDSNYQWVQFGQFDLTEKCSFTPEKIELMPLFRVVNVIKKLFLWPFHCNTYENIGEKDWQFHKPLNQLRTDLSIPIPLLKHNNSIGEHIHIKPILSEIKNYMFSHHIGNEKGKKGPFSILILKDVIKNLRIPAPLSSSILYIFVDFVKCFKDPNLFYNILDLYDTYNAFYHYLVDKLDCEIKTKIKQEDVQDNELFIELAKLSFLSDRDCYELTEISCGLENALHHRTRMTYSSSEWWNRVIDFKGEVNQLINAADVPLKCGLSILRRVIFYIENQKEQKNVNLDDDFEKIKLRVGGFSKLSYNSRVQSQRLKLRDYRDYFILNLELNIGHLVRPGFLYSHLHETGHLINDSLNCFNSFFEEMESRHQIDYGSINLNEYPEKKYYKRNFDILKKYKSQISDRFNEVFAEMFSYGLIFSDYHLGKKGYKFPEELKKSEYEIQIDYFRYYLGMYSLDPISTSWDKEEEKIKLAEVLTRAFLASDPFSNHQKNNGKGNLYSLDSYKLEIPDIENALKRFENILNLSGNFFYEFGVFWNNPEQKDYILEYFKRSYKISFPFVCYIWEKIENIIDFVLFGNSQVSGISPAPDFFSEILENINHGYQSGKPLLRILYDEPIPKDSNKSNKYKEIFGHLDAIFLVCRLLKFHIHEIFGKIDYNKSVVYIRDLKKYDSNSHLIDRFEGGLFSADIDFRSKYLKNRISIIKTFWDLSTNIRGRTFKNILDEYYQNHFSEEQRDISLK